MQIDCRSIANVRVCKGEYFHNFSCLATLKNERSLHTHTARERGHDYEQNLQISLKMNTGDVIEDATTQPRAASRPRFNN